MYIYIYIYYHPITLGALGDPRRGRFQELDPLSLDIDCFGFRLQQLFRNEEPKAVHRHSLYYYIVTFLSFVKSHYQSTLKIHERLHKPNGVILFRIVTENRHFISQKQVRVKNIYIY